MSEYNGGNRTFDQEKDTQEKKRKMTLPEETYDYDSGDSELTRSNLSSYPRRRPRLISSAGPASDEPDSVEVARLKAELAQAKYDQALQRARRRRQRAQVEHDQPSQSSSYPSAPSMEARGSQRSRYQGSQGDFEADNPRYGNAYLRYGAPNVQYTPHPTRPVNNVPLVYHPSGYPFPRANPPQPSIFAPPPSYNNRPLQRPISSNDFKTPCPPSRGRPSIGPAAEGHNSNSSELIWNQPSVPLLYPAIPSSRRHIRDVNTHRQPCLPQTTNSRPFAPGRSTTARAPPSRSSEQSSQNPASQHLGKDGRDDSEVSENEPQPKTKNQKKKEHNAARGKDIGTDGKEKGKVQIDDDGDMKVIINGEWVDAVHHHDRRCRLLEIADQNGRLSYTYPSAHGSENHDRMAFHPDYRDVNIKERSSRPAILYCWNPPKNHPSGEKNPGLMRDPDDGRILLDSNNHPIKNHKELPPVISGQVEGIWMELWRRLNPRISNADIVARTPRTTNLGPGKKEHSLTIQAYNNRMRRDRILLGTRAWSEREGSDKIQARLKEVMPERVLRELQENNSTQSWRDLNNEEITAIASVNRGQGTSLLRAGNRKLDPKTKQERDEAAAAKNTAVLQRLYREKERENQKDGLLGAAQSPIAVKDERLSNQEITEEDYSGYSPDPSDQDNSEFPETEDWDDPTFLDSQLEEGNTTLVQQAEIDKAIDPFEEGDKAQNSDQHVGSPTGDYRFQYPTTAIQMQSIDGALAITREECRDLTGVEPPATRRYIPYMQQQDELQQWLNGYMSGRAPRLYVRPAWFSDWDAWLLRDMSEFDSKAGNSTAGERQEIEEQADRPSKIEEGDSVHNPVTQTDPELGLEAFEDDQIIQQLDEFVERYDAEQSGDCQVYTEPQAKAPAIDPRTTTNPRQDIFDRWMNLSSNSPTPQCDNVNEE
ncbi:MAG: hypothetical protein Q9201_003162 [Fulgogasparrea decipioides]